MFKTPEDNHFGTNASQEVQQLVLRIITREYDPVVEVKTRFVFDVIDVKSVIIIIKRK